MRSIINITVASWAFSVVCSASVAAPRHPSLEVDATPPLASLESRAFPNAPNGYTPQGSNCPSTRPTIRSAQSGLSSQETSWLQARRKNTLPAMQDLLGRLNITGFDVNQYFSTHSGNTSQLPNIGIGVSGGGYRAMLNGGGAFQAFDSREANSTAAGHLGGLVQASTYFAGLSGGSWLVGSIYVNNFTTISGLLNDDTGNVWEFGNSVFTGPAQHGIQLLNQADYYKTIYDEVNGKSGAGYNTTITDYWGRSLSFQLINASTGGPDYTWSSIAMQDSFANGGSPLPIVITDGRAPGQILISANTTIYEFNPWEFGTFDPTTFGFAPLEYIGSKFSGGILADSEQCVRGFDNAGYVIGTSSSLFNEFYLRINTTSIPSAFKSILNDILGGLGQDNADIAEYSPNPFYGYHNSTSKNAQSHSLYLVDGGEDLQNIPLHPLIQPVRNVDIVFAVDSSADTTYQWPNGTSLVATYQRALNNSGIANRTAFPAIPDTNTFVNLGLNARPTFFGCDAKNISGQAPLVVYIPNAPYVYFSNVSTFDPAYNNSERNAIVENGYHVATMANGTIDPTWPTCVGCAILSRSFDRTGTTVPSACADCFKKFCWDGTLNATRPSEYEPKMKLAAINVQGSAAVGRRSSVGFLTVALLLGLGFVLL